MKRELTYNKWAKYIHDYQLKKDTQMEKETLKEFLIDDLKKLEKNVNELIDNVYASGKENKFIDDIENIDNFFSYWNHHLPALTTQNK
mgnify:CR=1 FL=1